MPKTYLYAPWRREYHIGKEKECVFCGISASENDDKNYIFYRDGHCFFVMNKFPYNPGHFMIIPHQHTSNLEDLSIKEMTHISLMAQKGIKILKRFGATGINIGFNLGKAGGAGIPEHIHMQLVPRFEGDTNLMTTLFSTRIYGADFDDIYAQIKEIAREIL